MAAWWTFSTPAKRYFLRWGRGKAVVDEAPGQSFSGVLVSDCYAKDIHSSPWHGLHSAAKKAKLRNMAYPVADVASGILCETCHRAHSLA